ncbi:putative subunit of trafficking protein particle complex II [Chloropicon primus]|nr:putative subunit of trafficking protein particle complex II [Chloropicon primus]
MVRFQSAGVVEGNMDFLSCGDATVAIFPVGQVPDARFWKYAELIASDNEIELGHVQAFYQERQKSPFSNLPWTNGMMRLKYQIDVNNLLKQEGSSTSGSPEDKRKGKRRSIFEENNILQDIKDYGNRRRTFGVVGVCSCADCPDVGKAYEEFLEVCRMYPNACALRCLMFDPSGSQIEQDHATATNMIMVPPSSGDALRQHMETVMQDFCAVMVMGLEQLALKADACDIPSRRLSFRRTSLDGEAGEDPAQRLSAARLAPAGRSGRGYSPSQMTASGPGKDLLNSSTEILKTAPELAQGEGFISRMTVNPNDDNAKRLKKRKFASVQRDIGFYCLASGSPVDALRHFSTSVELSQGVADFKTTVAALEGYLCSLLLLKQNYLQNEVMEEGSQIVWQSEELVSMDEILDLILLNLKLAGSEDLSITTLIKYARFLAANMGEEVDRAAGGDIVQKQSVQRKKVLLTQILQDVREYDGVNLLDTVILNLELSVVFEGLKQFRQQAFSLRKACETLREMLKVRDLDLDSPKSSGIQALVFNMLVSHRSKECQSTLVKFKKYLSSGDKCSDIQKLYSANRKRQGGSSFSWLACEVVCRNHDESTHVYEESKTVGSTPFLFSPKYKNKGRELIGSSADYVLWSVGKPSELWIRFSLRDSGDFSSSPGILDDIGASQMKLYFSDSCNVMTSFSAVSELRAKGKRCLQVKVTAIPLEAGESHLEGVQILQSGSSRKVMHTAKFENLKRPLHVKVVKRLPVLATRFSADGTGPLKVIHLLESEQKEFCMDHRNVGEVVIRRLEFASSVSESDSHEDRGRLQVRHEDMILEEGTQLGLGEMKRLRISFSSGAMDDCADVVERRVRFTVLLSDRSKQESKMSKDEKTIVKTQTLDIRVVVHRGLSVNRIFLPRDGMLRAIEGQGTCVDVSNLSGEDIEICQDLALEHDAGAGEGGAHLLAKRSGTKEFLLKLPKSYEKHRQDDLFLRWRTKRKGRRGEIKLLGTLASKSLVDPGTTYAAILQDGSPFRFCHPCTGTVAMVSGEGGKVQRKDCKAFEVKVSSHLPDACSVTFDIRCLCEDGSTVSSNDVILTGVLSFSNLKIPANAEGHRICKFGACFLSPGVYNFALCQKSPSDLLYTDRKEILVE